MSALTTGTALGAGLLGGLYLAFSVAVLPALRRRPPDEAAALMRAVNTAIVNPVFGLLFAGTGVAAAVLAGAAALDGRWPVAAGAALVVVGFGVTFAVNIPLNRALDRGGDWAGFARPWTRAHSVRTLLTVAGAALLVV